MAQGKKYDPNEKDLQLVTQMAAVGINHEQIAAVIGITHETLVKYYKEPLETSKSKAITKVAGTLYNKALKGDNACMIFYLKTQGGWRETTHHEVTGKDGAPMLAVIREYDPKK